MLEGNASPSKNLADLQWVVQNRSSNQLSTLAIYKVLSENKELINKNPRLRASAQTLLGIAFSLWRAVFLADIKQIRGSMLADVEGFLLELIRNNAITYTQDKKHNTWTFRYYMQNATNRLETLHQAFKFFEKTFVLPSGSMGKQPKEWWVLHQRALDAAILQFEIIVTSPLPKRPTKKRSSTEKRISN